MAEIRQWIEAESAGQYFFYVFSFALAALLIWFKGRRVRFLIPAVLISAVIVNPIFYQKWTELGLYAYWRALWVIPVIPVLATVIPSITEQVCAVSSTTTESSSTKKIVGTAFITVAGVVTVILGGTYLYKGQSGDFSAAANSAKIPNIVVEVADRLIELDEHPKIVADYDMAVYIRQYTGEIDTLYGRDLYGYILKAGPLARTINDALNADEWETVNQEMLDDDYDFLVTQKEVGDGFELLDEVGPYHIYSATGAPSVIKERNELGQVVSVTTVDENGNPQNGDFQYATIAYTYDEYGRIIKEFHTDADGMGVANLEGVAGYEKEYDNRDHVIMERELGSDGMPIIGSGGYAEVRRGYAGSDLIREDYFDENGEPVNRIDTGYATVEMEYDEVHNRISEYYFDIAGDAVQNSFGYAVVRRVYDQRRMTEEAYFDENDATVVIAAGYAEKRRAYDEAGNITTEAYFDASGKPTTCINGYAQVEREYDGEKNVVMERFRDEGGQLVVTGSGYAEVHRMYQGQHLNREEYYGADGKPMMQTAGYYAIEQVWNGDDLYARLYLGADGFPINRIDGYAKAVWESGDTCTNITFYNLDGVEVEIDDLNLTKDIKTDADGWSEWVTPNFNSLNSTYNIGYVNLGEKSDGDVYTCQMEIEFKNVSATKGQAFGFWTQGAQDSRWFTGNVWNSNLISLGEAPEDGVYAFTTTNSISGAMVDVSTFNLGFRCDYWASGSYRVRLVKIEKGDQAGAWSPGV